MTTSISQTVHPTRRICTVCQKKTRQICKRCQKIYYCSVECQTSDWEKHKKYCVKKEQNTSTTDSNTRKVFNETLGINTPEKNQEMFDDLVNRAKKIETFQGYKRCRKIFFRDIQDCNLKKLPDTIERQIMWLTSFSYSEIPKVSFDGFNNIPGIEIIERYEENDPRLQNDCSAFLFNNKKWFDNDNTKLKASLFNNLPETTKFLNTKEYVEVNTPQAGDIVVYSTNISNGPTIGSYITDKKTKVSHYGEIVSIDNRTIIVESKFPEYHTYRHRIELIPYFFGDKYSFFRLASQ